MGVWRLGCGGFGVVVLNVRKFSRFWCGVGGICCWVEFLGILGFGEMVEVGVSRKWDCLLGFDNVVLGGGDVMLWWRFLGLMIVCGL